MGIKVEWKFFFSCFFLENEIVGQRLSVSFYYYYYYFYLEIVGTKAR